jgi:hypothetical protein
MANFRATAEGNIAFTQEEEAEWEAEQAERMAAALIPSVPAFVTMRQARLALLGAGLLASIESSIAGLPSPQKEAAEIEWQYSSEVQRHNGFVSVLAPLLGLTDLQVDNLFIAAKDL